MRSAYAVWSFNWSPSLNSWSIKGDDHHEDPVFSLYVDIQQNKLNTCVAGSRRL
jgi:hypothetical protein